MNMEMREILRREGKREILRRSANPPVSRLTLALDGESAAAALGYQVVRDASVLLVEALELRELAYAIGWWPQPQPATGTGRGDLAYLNRYFEQHPEPDDGTGRRYGREDTCDQE